MRIIHTLPFLLVLPLAAACSAGAGSTLGSGGSGGGEWGSSGQGPSSTNAGPSGSGGATNAGATSGGVTSGGNTTTGGNVPLTCDTVDQGIGCCDQSGVLHYCSQQGTVVDQPCTGGTVCGWSAQNAYYDCVQPPGGSDPGAQYPMACGGSSGSSSSSSGGGSTSSSTTSSSSTGGGPAVTWTDLYTQIFGPNGTSNCSRGGGCHTYSQSGFKCGTTKTTCYNGMVSASLVSPGASASSSYLVDPQYSPLCGSLGGNMPQIGSCVTASQITMIKSWLATGAPDN